ncbi:hypothetical protein BaRGS_00029120 [Batillaria attramentaria]|uniref:Uncharacterized protein n=1 Tax=Batillaria attramentaria TaxID=370345 RepID=A0ABD0JY46_9CAEN
MSFFKDGFSKLPERETEKKTLALKQHLSSRHHRAIFPFNWPVTGSKATRDRGTPLPSPRERLKKHIRHLINPRAIQKQCGSGGKGQQPLQLPNTAGVVSASGDQCRRVPRGNGGPDGARDQRETSRETFVSWAES